MTQDNGACAEQNQSNGITVKADKDFGAIELALVVNEKKIGCFLTVKEAHDIAEALKGAICQMMGDETCGGRCSEEKLQELNESYREDDAKTTDKESES